MREQVRPQQRQQVRQRPGKARAQLEVAQLIDPEGNPLTINGLWALQFGNGARNGGNRHKLFFTAGIADESHGLFGFLKAGRKEVGDDDTE